MRDQDNIKELIPVETLNELLDFFTSLTGVAGVVMDLEGNYISKPSRYTRHCRDFIQATPEGKKACREFIKKPATRPSKTLMVHSACALFSSMTTRSPSWLKAAEPEKETVEPIPTGHERILFIDNG